MWMKLLLAAAILQLVISDGHDSPKTLTVTMDPEEKFNVSWAFDGMDSNSYITFNISCRTTGWVGLGFSPSGSMKDADIIMAWTLSGGVRILDMHATANGLPVKDDSQDITLISHGEVNGVTRISFKRKLNTCDKEQDYIITTDTVRLIWAYGDSDPTGDLPAAQNYHLANRGSRSIFLLDLRTFKSSYPADAMFYDMTINNYSVPPVDTIYYCSFYNLPKLDTKHHVVAVEPVVQKGNEALVHHILLYSCWDIEKEHIRNNTKTEGVCFSEEMPEFSDSCRNVFVAWAVGGTVQFTPDDVGHPIGATDGSTPEYYMMEVHYDNPQKLDSFVDASGFRLVYTPTLRSHDAGIFSMGAIAGIAAPPQPDQFRVSGFCDSSCTAQWIPDTGVELFQAFMHSHLLGVAIRIDWYRAGSHIGVIAQDNAYDFNFQEGRELLDKPKLYPGDTLKITCTYTDKLRPHPTLGGISTREEMCLGFLSYYPRQKLSKCESINQIAVNSQDPVYTILGVDASVPGTPIANMYKLYEVTNWTAERVEALQGALDQRPHLSICEETSERGYPFQYQIIVPQLYPLPEPENDTTCDVTTTTTIPTTPTTTKPFGRGGPNFIDQGLNKSARQQSALPLFALALIFVWVSR